MTQEQWLTMALEGIYGMDENEVVSVVFVKAIIEAMCRQDEQHRQAEPQGQVIAKGTSRSTKRNPRLSKAQREAAALRQVQEDTETGFGC